MPITLSECVTRMMGTRVMVTGGAGFIGSHLVDYLLAHGVQHVIMIDNLTRPRLDWLKRSAQHPQITFIEADILDKEKMESALAGVDVVFHLAAVATVMNAVRDPERTFAVNAMATAQVAMAARRAGVRRLVFSSSREVYGDPAVLPVTEDSPMKPKNVYGASKAAGEMFLSSLGPIEMEIVIVRLANVYGPGDSGRVIPIFLNNAQNGQPLILYGGEQVLDLVWIGDVVEALVKAAFSEKPVLEPTNIGSGTVTSLRTLARRIVELIGSDTPIQIVPPRGPEVEAYQADLARAERYYGLGVKADPLDKLPDMLAEVRATKSK